MALKVFWRGLRDCVEASKTVWRCCDSFYQAQAKGRDGAPIDSDDPAPIDSYPALIDLDLTLIDSESDPTLTDSVDPADRLRSSANVLTVADRLGS